ncbi:hypothetical protein [Methylomarinovum caldicuralii]|uniref:hypothetical protein n=1 Tax=Methylomarinovum caldicuralii TaxID=438856 RepID=UPI002954D687|nr:hypothetical protein [Methylomarinovum caldicuralii]
MTRQRKRHGLWIFWLIVLIGTAPWLGAWYLVRHPGLWGTPGNHGQLLQPPRPLSYEQFQPVPGARKDLKEIRGRWVMMHVIVPGDEPACRQVLDDTRRLHPLFSKDIPRVRRLAVWGEDRPPAAGLRSQLFGDRDLYLARVPPDFAARLAGWIGRPLRCGQLFLMDPLGNLMMWYDAGFDPYGLYRDLKRLLKASRIG